MYSPIDSSVKQRRLPPLPTGIAKALLLPTPPIPSQQKILSCFADGTVMQVDYQEIQEIYKNDYSFQNPMPREFYDIFENHFDKFKRTRFYPFEKNTIRAICKVIFNRNLCLKLLKPLDAALGSLHYPTVSDFSYLTLKDKALFWPVPSELISEYLKANIKNFSKKDLLSDLLLQNEQSQMNINKGPIQLDGIDYSPIANFVGFVKEEDANSWLLNYGLWHDYPLISIAALHGKYSHRLQWYIISEAIRTGEFQFNYSLQNLRRFYPSAKSVVHALFQMLIKFNLWGPILDYFAFHIFSYTFGSPFFLHSYLLNSPDLPNLRGYLVNAYLKKLYKQQEIASRAMGCLVPLKHLVVSMMLKENRFEVNSDYPSVSLEQCATRFEAKGWREHPQYPGIFLKPILSSKQ